MTYLMDGSTDGFDVASAGVSFVGNAGQDYTFFAWFRLTTNANQNTIMSKTDNSPSDWNRLIMHDLGAADFQLWDGITNPLIQSTPTYEDDTWRSIAAQNDVSQPRIDVFVNGVIPSYDTDQNHADLDVDNTDVLAIGYRGQGVAGEYYTGSLSNIVIWDVVLTNDEQLALASGVNPFAIEPANIKCNCPLDGNDSPENNYATPADTAAHVGTPVKYVGNPPVELLENYL